MVFLGFGSGELGWCALLTLHGIWQGRQGKQEGARGGGAREGSLGVLGGRSGTISFVFFFSLGPGVETKNVFTWGMFLGILGRRGGGWGTTLDKFYGTRC